jgi:hypothetical protein
MKLPSSGATIDTTGARTEVGTALRTVRARGQARKTSMDDLRRSSFAANLRKILAPNKSEPPKPNATTVRN